MSRPQNPFPTPVGADRCPCLSGEVFRSCCEPFLSGRAEAPTAEQLMRSRYTAFVVGAVDHLRRTWHPSTRPAELELDPSIRWYRLDVLRREGGGPLDAEGVVEFRAYSRHDGERHELHEVSRFTREGGRWWYVSGV
jgi:SEC-C motif-containing protein